MINHRVLNLSERRQFRRHYESFGIGTISDDYLKNTIVRGFFDQNGGMVGGHIVNQISSNSRYLSFIPKTNRSNLPICTESMAEICCVWMDKKITSKNIRLFMYLQGLLDAKSTNSKFIVAGTTNEKNKLIQQFVFPKKLWNGVATHGALQYIHYTEIDKLISNWITAIPKYHIYKLFRKLVKYFTSRPKHILKNLGEA
ncbi:MAG: hypothetical protein HRU09_08100 [Oligoflexales bacterium]|nr:hypothetical protein [Oligoflexales bacterium]